MTSILLMLLVPVIRVQRVSPAPSCPVHCVVCSEDAVICQRLAHVIDAPDSTKALLLTEGSISAVPSASLSELSNITVLGLSRNHISELHKEAFSNLAFLHTLQLDHNLLTSQALQGGALANLTQLKVLALGHNLISVIKASWFKGTKALLSLKLEGNLLTGLDDGFFPLTDLQELESLDLSDNLIELLDRNSFRGLASLRTLDLSRNRLSSAPAEAFSYLSWLTDLNLDLNSWNCSCELLELAAVLSSFVQHPDKTLYNGRRMVCVSADNPAVTTVLELTEANCVPSNQNITVQIETRDGVTPQLYARDLAVTAVICFIGGVGLTLLAVLIHHQVSQWKNLKGGQRLKEEEERVGHLNVRERTREFFLQANSSRPWNEEATLSDTRKDGGQFRSRAPENGGYLQCPHCNPDGSMANPVRKENWMNGWTETEQDLERRRMRTTRVEERWTGLQQGNFIMDVPHKLHSNGNMNSFSRPLRESVRTETLPYYTGRDINNQKADLETKSSTNKTLHRQREQNVRRGKIHSLSRDSSAPRDSGRHAYYQFDKTKNMALKREMRNVTFDLESLRVNHVKEGPEEEASMSKDKEKERERTRKVQSNHLMKVKLNLNPLRKSKVHPRRKNEQEHAEMSSSKKNKGKREYRKQGEKRETKGKSDKKTKNGSKKTKKSSKTKAVAREDEGESKGGEGHQKKTTSINEQDGQESTEPEQGESTHPVCSPSSQSNASVDQPASTGMSAQTQSLQSFHQKGAGVTLSSTQHPFSSGAADRNTSSSFSLTGAAGSQLAGTGLSLKTGNPLLNSTTSGSNTLLPGDPVNPTAPGKGTSVPNMAPGDAADGLGRQAAGGIMSSAPSLLANTAHATPLKTSALDTAPEHLSQTKGLPLNLAVPALYPAPVQLLSQSLMPLDSSLVAAVQLPPPPQSQAHLNNERPPDQGHNTSGVTPQDLRSATTVETMLRHFSQAETGHGGSTVDMPPGGVAPSERATAQGYAESSQEVGVPLSGDSAHNRSSVEVATGAAALVQQEYLPEEGGSSPRRKLRLVLPEKTSSHPPTALEKKIR